MKATTLEKYIETDFNDSQSCFARSQGVKPQQVSQWIKKEFVIVNGNLYSLRRELKTKINKSEINK